jgi:HK97 family phage major capsid protein
MSPAVLAQLIALNATVITWSTSSAGVASGAIPKNILGYEYLVTEKVPTLGTTGDIGLYDLSYYGIGDRSELRMDISPHLYFQTDETAFRFVERVDGHSLVDNTFTPYNGGATLSPFVQLSSATA